MTLSPDLSQAILAAVDDDFENQIALYLAQWCGLEII